MLIFNDVIDELASHGVPDEVINRLIVKLLVAGQQSVYAALGEMHGVHTVTRVQLGILVAGLIAHQKEHPVDISQVG